jgi:hypothetical protein
MAEGKLIALKMDYNTSFAIPPRSKSVLNRKKHLILRPGAITNDQSLLGSM